MASVDYESSTATENTEAIEKIQGLITPVRMDCRGMSEIHLPFLLGDSSHPRGHVWRVPEGIVQAEENFLAHLRELLAQHDGKWIYMTAAGKWGIYPTQDDAEIAALHAGYDASEFVVRQISHLELPDIS
jgi:hypothetical protein